MFRRRCVIVFLLFCFQLKNSENRLTMKISNLECKSLDNSYLNFTECKMKAISRDISEISMYINIFKKLSENVSLDVYATRSNKRFMQFHIDCCVFLRNKRRNPAAEFLYNVMQLVKYSNINHTCPYDHDIIIDKWRLSENTLTTFPILQGDYTLSGTFHAYNKPIAAIDLRLKIFTK